MEALTAFAGGFISGIVAAIVYEFLWAFWPKKRKPKSKTSSITIAAAANNLKRCHNCLHADLEGDKEPCNTCEKNSNWHPKALF